MNGRVRIAGSESKGQLQRALLLNGPVLDNQDVFLDDQDVFLEDVPRGRRGAEAAGVNGGRNAPHGDDPSSKVSYGDD